MSRTDYRLPVINFTTAPPRYKSTLFCGKCYDFTRADIWIDQHWGVLKFAEKLNPEYKATEDRLIKKIVNSIAHEMMHILTGSNDEEFIASIPKTQYSVIYWCESQNKHNSRKGST